MVLKTAKEKSCHVILQSHPGRVFRKDENSNLKGHMHPSVHSSTIHMQQPKYPSSEKRIEKMWYTYTMEFYAAKKKCEIMPFAATWMDLETAE